jgi:hypothetical protein
VGQVAALGHDSALGTARWERETVRRGAPGEQRKNRGALRRGGLPVDKRQWE